MYTITVNDSINFNLYADEAGNKIEGVALSELTIPVAAKGTTTSDVYLDLKNAAPEVEGYTLDYVRVYYGTTISESIVGIYKVPVNSSGSMSSLRAVKDDGSNTLLQKYFDDDSKFHVYFYYTAK